MIEEPYRRAEAYLARREAEYEAMTRHAVCADCQNYDPAPDAWARVPHGWCAEHHEHTRGDEQVLDNCNSFDPTRDYWGRVEADMR